MIDLLEWLSFAAFVCIGCAAIIAGAIKVFWFIMGWGCGPV